MILASSAGSGWNCIFRNAAGIVFLGTPHRGSPLASAASVISEHMPGASMLLPILQANSSAIIQIADRFNNLWGPRPLFSFRETTKTHKFMVTCCSISLQCLLTNFDCQVVPKDSAVTNCQNEMVYDIVGCNHSEISKPESVDGVLFQLIPDVIRSLLQPRAKSTDAYSTNVDFKDLEMLEELPPA